MSVHQYLHTHPIIGLFLSGTFLFTGTVMPHTDLMIPEVVMQLAQLTFWGTGALFAYLTYKKKK